MEADVQPPVWNLGAPYGRRVGIYQAQQVFISDISGDTEMDAQVAGHLTKVAKASQFMGGDCIISGVSPLVTQYLVDL